MVYIKKYWWVLLIAVVAITAPLVINWVILQPQKFEVVGDGTHWLGFWATYISAIASFAMVFITWYTLKQNKEQLNELKRQWEEERRPCIIFTIQSVGYGIYHLKITNTGKSIAKNITFELDEKYIEYIKIERLKNYLKNVGDTPMQLLPQEYVSFSFTMKPMSKTITTCILGSNEDNSTVEENYQSMSSLNCTITGKYNDKYIISQTIGLKNHYIEPIQVNESLTYIYGELRQINEKIK